MSQNQYTVFLYVLGVDQCDLVRSALDFACATFEYAQPPDGKTRSTIGRFTIEVDSYNLEDPRRLTVTSERGVRREIRIDASVAPIVIVRDDDPDNPF